MKVYRDPKKIEKLKRPLVAAIGNFDGIHLGHRKTLGEAVVRARAEKGTSLCVTFHPHPSKILKGDSSLKTLMTDNQKSRAIEEIGLDALLLVEFTERFSDLSPERFVEEYLLENLDLKTVYTGRHFRFGKGRKGTVETLERYGKKRGFEAVGVAEVLHKGEPISSSRIRLAVEKGEMEEAAAMLGGPYTVEGTIVRGKRRGKELGYPTVNLRVDNEVLPDRGVYLTRSLIDGKGLDGITNVGFRPTFDDDERELTVETFLLDFDGPVRAERKELAFLKRIREEMKFDSAEDLIARIGEDVRLAEEFFSK